MVISALQSYMRPGGQKFNKKTNQINKCLITICHDINIPFTLLNPRDMLNVL